MSKYEFKLVDRRVNSSPTLLKVKLVVSIEITKLNLPNLYIFLEFKQQGNNLLVEHVNFKETKEWEDKEHLGMLKAHFLINDTQQLEYAITSLEDLLSGDNISEFKYGNSWREFTEQLSDWHTKNIVPILEDECCLFNKYKDDK